MRWLPPLLLFALLLPLTNATTLVDARSGDEIGSGIIRLEWDGQRSEQVLTDSIELPPETVGGLLVLVNTNGSQTFDYYARISPGSVPRGVILHPAGLLTGVVSDARQNLLVNKEARLSCPSVEEEAVTDQSGQFRIFLPVGNCSVAVAANGHAGRSSALIRQGEATRINLLVDQPISQEGGGASFAWILFLLLLLIILLWYILTRPPARSPTDSRKERVGAFLAEQHKEALKEKERLLIDELLLREGRAKLAELRRATGIPRTSLLRCLEGLEQRGLLLKKSENKKPVIELVKK